ncbi:hypothetical protein DEM27_05690 [Metarhizobium album]|uniref:Uncharacterized protein n=1 Tax=Metarhizobium album TaxID=2182425 RepID=A0A2U2DV02_9HYPH|nr:hypothetical protein [Rhizobium album]PWE57132.1 hypothetical protein DEM27_05690 [Rhizobium album]
MINVRPGRLPKPSGSSGGGRQPSSAPLIYPAPKMGLITTAGLADEISGAAAVLDNWLPTLRGARIRGGSAKAGLVEDLTSLISAFRYKFATVEKLFMSTSSAIYDVSNPPALPDAITADVDGLTGGDWSTFQHANSSGGYLIAVNGQDERQVFDGVAWSTTPEITFEDGDPTTSATFSHGWVFKKREFFIKAGTLDAYYLSLTDNIGGEAKVFPLGGEFSKGGSLITGFTWSFESGDGPNSYCVFVTSEGEAVVYAGSDPEADFVKVGVYQLGKPLGKNAYLPINGDVLVCTIPGLRSMSSVLQRGTDQPALSQAIEEEWSRAAVSTGDGWRMTWWEEQNLILISFPPTVVVPDTTFVLHSQTKCWSFIRNWPANCFGTREGRLFFGGLEGIVWSADATGSDDGQPFQATYLSQFIAAGKFGQRKAASLAQMYFRGKEAPNVMLFARADGDTSIPTQSTVTVGNENASVWDIGLWDVAVWDEVSSLQRFNNRQNVRAHGETLAVGCAVTSSGPYQLTLQIDLATLQTHVGEMVA